MKNCVQKWGNSLGLRIPSAIAAEMHVKRGTPVTLQLQDGVLTVRAALAARRKASRFKLRELLDRITPENVQPTYDWGHDVGREIL
jgi:antitoxin MazE